MTKAAVEGVEDGVNAAADVDEKQASWRGKVSPQKAEVVLHHGRIFLAMCSH
jgi:hypothetical protein